jgi:hypothetical protein
MKQLADSHAQQIENLHDDYRAKQLHANENAEKVARSRKPETDFILPQAIKEHTEARTRDLAALTTAHQTKQREDRAAAEKVS